MKLIETIPILFPIRNKISLAVWKEKLFIIPDEGGCVWNLEQVLKDKSFDSIPSLCLYCNFIAGVIHIRNDRLLFADTERNSIHLVECGSGIKLESVKHPDFNNPIAVDFLDSNSLIFIEQSNQKVSILNKDETSSTWQPSKTAFISYSFQNPSFIVKSQKFNKILIADLNGLHIFNISDGIHCETISNPTIGEKLYCFDEDSSTIYAIDKVLNI